jgi:DNA-binding response OmpR family regulator
MPTVLIVDDEKNIRATLARALRLEGYRTDEAEDGVAALAVLEQGGIDAILADVQMPRLDGLGLLEALRERGLAVPAIILTAHGTIERAVRAVKLGAFDFIEKPPSIERVLLALENALDRGRLERENLRLAEEAGIGGEIAGISAAIAALRATLGRVAPTEATVLLLGENGTGKELAARALHAGSRRAGKPFVVVNCAAIPETLFESELFGHVKGAFTGATDARRGKFQQADGGTLFLDEIGETPAALQPKLLRAAGIRRRRNDRRTRRRARGRPADRRDEPRPGRRSGRRSLPAGPLLPAGRGARDASGLFANGARTSRCWPYDSWNRPAGETACGRRRSIPARLRPCPTTFGRAMSASCATRWSAPRSLPPPTSSAPRRSASTDGVSPPPRSPPPRRRPRRSARAARARDRAGMSRATPLEDDASRRRAGTRAQPSLQEAQGLGNRAAGRGLRPPGHARVPDPTPLATALGISASRRAALLAHLLPSCRGSPALRIHGASPGRKKARHEIRHHDTRHDPRTGRLRLLFAGCANEPLGTSGDESLLSQNGSAMPASLESSTGRVPTSIPLDETFGPGRSRRRRFGLEVRRHRVRER